MTDFPDGDVIITNPPYLARNSATRRGLDYPKCEYDDLYKYCLDVMLKNASYVAAIIPESFLTSRLFHNRLFAVISLTCKMFDDTDCPVCLALFSPESECDGDFLIYQENRLIGLYSELSEKCFPDVVNHKVTFNDPEGILGIVCIDDTKSNSIRFVRGETIPSSDIKVSSRSKTRVTGNFTEDELDELIETANRALNDYRMSTYDVFLTAFKGLRKDGKYRRRLDFKTANQIIEHALNEMRGDDDAVE